MVNKYTNNVESPIVELQNGNQNFLTADELMQRLEPRIRAMFQ